MSPVTNLVLQPSTSVVDLFSEQGALNATSHELAGTISFNLSCRMAIRAIYVKWKGTSTSVHQRNPERLRMTDTRSTFVLCKEKISVLTTPTTLDAGDHTYNWTLSFSCDNLPPSIDLPQHNISYTVSAQVIADGYLRRPSVRAVVPITINRHSLGAIHLASYIPNIRYRGQRADKLRYEFELPKMACMQLRRFDFAGKLVPFMEGCQANKVTVRLDQIETYSINHPNMLDKRASKQYSSDGIISHVSQIGRKCTHLSTYTPLDKNNVAEVTSPALNSLNSIWLFYLLLDTEFNIEDTMSLTQHLSLYLPLTSPLISPTLKSQALNISHRIRLRLYFEDEKEMALSFPLVISTAPVQDALASPPSSPISLTEEGWLRGLITDSEVGMPPAPLDQLPSYDDVLSEGLPPLVFTETLNAPIYH
ncbi:hypothetical protein INT43_000852 [Umbelopsis isabellina]|uniref:Arrestin-like N-terminal domain-containing protein n=1 Tax=Mortierella isabellina TaxID=91625 RepID=A0A8H7Q4K9_MORIS|nr:hypothetical protein INT43_000852 [Umbelopsis isabellina]